MTALLDALERTRGRRGRTLAAVAATGVAAGGVLVAMLVPASPETAPCPEAEERLRGVWDEERAMAMNQAFEASRLPYADDAWTLTRARLDAHAHGWSERYQELCAHMGVQADAAHDLEMACLHRRREELGALVELLVGGDPAVIARATQAAAELAPAASCRREGVEAAAMASPDAGQQPEVDEIRLTLARAEAAFKAGTLDVGIEHAERALERARRVNYPPVEVEALHRLGTLQAMAGRLDEAVANLGDASLRAVAVRHDRIAARAAGGAAFVVGYQQGRPEEGLVWMRHATAALERLEPDPVLEAELRINRAAIHSAQGRFEEALEEFRIGLEQRERALGGDHPLVASAYNNLGSALVELGRFEAALEALEHAKSVWQQSYGPRHPVVATVITGIGAVLEQMGRYPEARTQLEQALALRTELFGADHVSVAITLDNLGSVLARLGELEQARTASQRALDLRAKHLGTRHPHYASSLLNLGLVAERQGRLDEAQDLQRRAIELWEEVLGPEHPYLGHPLTSLGRVEQRLGHRSEAQVLLGRALRIREASGKPVERAETFLALGDALWPDDPVQARSMVERAARELRATAHGPQSLREEVAGWLVEHPAPAPVPVP